ncbi:3-deoxy-manno-octulosonate cytidylyltransferase [Candidatus Desulfarcum epimagneticum]|uniref:3-deoxy-manno-octulosonate cytidylyltransferase n=1 Tax=uncultured Desulfobacteraceae bacterium TaxID=218296 RepID=A0A484HMW7_9BACT|nr:3-deoxy-manno-octulosonate cytidylyltransferase [uncultured Desulfobacteraceae bacterium]
MKVVALIPARFASTRFRGKPLAEIAGKPMIRMVCERVAAARLVSETAVATDDPRIRDAVTAFGGRVVMTSPESRSGTDRLSEAADKMGLKDDDIVVNVQGDQPLVHPDCVNEVVEPFFSDPGLGMSTLAFKIVNKRETHDPKDVKVVFDSRGNALYFSRSPIPHGRDTECDMFKHLGIYAYTQKFLKEFAAFPPGRLEDIEKLEQLRALEQGRRIRVVVTRHDSPEVDLPEDIARIERAMEKEPLTPRR